MMLNYAGIPFENFAFPRDQWPELKQKMPYGQVPVLEVRSPKYHVYNHYNFNM
jgi:glutathione S-transferase